MKICYIVINRHFKIYCSLCVYTQSENIFLKPTFNQLKMIKDLK
jgi:hypothetical protein